MKFKVTTEIYGRKSFFFLIWDFGQKLKKKINSQKPYDTNVDIWKEGKDSS